MTSISATNFGYGQYPVHPRKIKPVSEENQPTEQASSSSYGVQGGKVALQAGGTLLGASFAGGTAGWLTHQQEREASKKSSSASQSETPEKIGFKEKVFTKAEIDDQWVNKKEEALREIEKNILSEQGLFQDNDVWTAFEGDTSKIPKTLEEAKPHLIGTLQKREIAEANKQSLKSSYGFVSDVEWTAKVNEVKPKVQQMKNFDVLNQFLNVPDQWADETRTLLTHDNNEKLLKDALATNDHTTLKTVINNLAATGLDAEDLSSAKMELLGLNTLPVVTQEELLAYHYKQADTNLTWEQAKIKAQATFDQNKQRIEAEFKTPAKVAEVEKKAKQLWNDAQENIKKEIAKAEATFRASKAPKVKPPTVNTLVEESFFKEVTKGGKTTKVAGGVALGALLLGAGLTAYSAYQDGHRKLPTKYPNLSAEG